MTQKAFILNFLLFFSLLSFSAKAQKTIVDIGVGYQFSQASGFTLRQEYGSTNIDTGITYREGGGLISVMVGKNIPLIRLHKFALAVNPSLVVGAGGESFAAAIPVYAVLKYGTDATREEETKFGASIGIGESFNAYSSMFEDVYWSPTWLGEISMNIPAGIIRLRATGNLNEFERSYPYREGAINTGHHVLKQPLNLFFIYTLTY